MNSPGILKDIEDYILDTAQRQQPIFARQGALALAATVCAQRFATETGLRSNLYLLTIGKTSSGKEDPRRAIKKILRLAGLDSRIGGESIASGAGLLSRVSQTPAVLFQLDEFGRMLEELSDKKASPHLASIKTNMIKLFTSATSIFVSTEYSDQKANPRHTIEYPCVVIHGTGNEVELFAGMSSRDLVNGFLNRFIMAESKTRPPLQYAFDDIPVPPKILEWIADATTTPQDSLVGITPGSPIVVAFEDAARKYWRKIGTEFDNKIDLPGVGNMYARGVEHVAKIALVASVAINPKRPVITVECVDFALRVFRDSIAIAERAITNSISDTDYERHRQQILTALKELGAKGITSYEMGRVSPFRGFSEKVRTDILNDLLGANQVVFDKIVTGSGRPRYRYFAVEDVRELDESGDEKAIAKRNGRSTVSEIAEVFSRMPPADIVEKMTHLAVVDPVLAEKVSKATGVPVPELEELGAYYSRG